MKSLLHFISQRAYHHTRSPRFPASVGSFYSTAGAEPTRITWRLAATYQLTNFPTLERNVDLARRGSHRINWGSSLGRVHPVGMNRIEVAVCSLRTQSDNLSDDNEPLGRRRTGKDQECEHANVARRYHCPSKQDRAGSGGAMLPGVLEWTGAITLTIGIPCSLGHIGRRRL